MNSIVWKIITQAAGILAMLLLLASYQINNRKKILIMQICISICWTVHYGMLGALSGAVINIICFLRNILFYDKQKKWAQTIVSPIFVCAAEIIAAILTWSGNADMLALIGAPLQTAAIWMNSPGKIRILMLTASPMWMIYDYLNGSYPGVITEIGVMLSIIIAMHKYHDIPVKKMKGAANDNEILSP